jgi:hypothetical protein
LVIQLVGYPAAWAGIGTFRFRILLHLDAAKSGDGENRAGIIFVSRKKAPLFEQRLGLRSV